jgi:hypothetical protein
MNFRPFNRLLNRAGRRQQFRNRLARRIVRRVSIAFLTWFGVSDIPLRTVSLVPTTDQPSNELPGSIPTTNGWLADVTS